MNESLDPGLLAFLRDPASYPHRPREVREIHTHASLVLVAPPLVYKIKKPVDFGFLDFSTLEKRRLCCLREVELNSRLAPGVYLGVEPVTREGEGYAFGGGGPVAEYAVKMAYLEPAGFLAARIKAGAAGGPELERVARTLADFYQKQPSPPDVAEWGRVAKLRISTDENFAQTRAFIGKTLSAAAFEAIRAFTESCYERRGPLFERRVAQGWIRDCHGDLHLDHIHVTDSALHIYDCIEFNDRLRHLDVAGDAAFLAMDLDHHGRPELARLFIRRLADLLGDSEMEDLMDYYKCYRAYVRGKVESLRAFVESGGDGGRGEAAAAARCYFQLALQYAVAGCSPVALAVMGRVAAGKSTLAAALSRELGWRLISSDVRRKELAGVPLHQRGDACGRRMLYAPEMTARTYESMIDDAAAALAAGQCVILDATFSSRMLRERLRDTLGDAHVKWIIAEVDDATTEHRLRQRDGRGDLVTDARSADMAMLNSAYEPPDELPAGTAFHTCNLGEPDEVSARVIRNLATAPD